MRKIGSFALLCMLFVFLGCTPPEPVTEDPCGLGGSDLLSYYFQVQNNTDSEVRVRVLGLAYNTSGKKISVFDDDEVEDLYDADSEIYNDGKKHENSLITHPECYDYAHYPLGSPTADKVIYELFIIRIIENNQTHDYIAVGGSKEAYEADFLDSEGYTRLLPENIEVLGYNYFYVPGTKLREELGLKKYYDDDYAIYSGIDPNKKIQGYGSGVTLKLTINGPTKDDLVWSLEEYTFDPISP